MRASRPEPSYTRSTRSVAAPTRVVVALGRPSES